VPYFGNYYLLYDYIHVYVIYISYLFIYFLSITTKTKAVDVYIAKTIEKGHKYDEKDRKNK
jgi:hypothetical protein